MTTALASPGTSPRLAWVLGGSLLIGSVVVTITTQDPVLLWGSGRIVGTLFFAAALLVFALGIRGAGSITAGRPLGTVALIALALWGVLSMAVWELVTPTVLAVENWGWLSLVDRLVGVAIALVAVVQIARAGTIPRPWNWAPTWALAAMVVTGLLTYVVGTGANYDELAIWIALNVDGVVRAAAPVFLGILAVFFAGALTRSPVEQPEP